MAALEERYCYNCGNALQYSDHVCANCGRNNFGKSVKPCPVCDEVGSHKWNCSLDQR